MGDGVPVPEAVGEGVALAGAVGDCEAGRVPVPEAVPVGVFVAVWDAVGVRVPVPLAVSEGEEEGVCSAEGVAVAVAEALLVVLGVRLPLLLGVRVAEGEGDVVSSTGAGAVAAKNCVAVPSPRPSEGATPTTSAVQRVNPHPPSGCPVAQDPIARVEGGASISSRAIARGLSNEIGPRQLVVCRWHLIANLEALLCSELRHASDGTSCSIENPAIAQVLLTEAAKANREPRVPVPHPNLPSALLQPQRPRSNTRGWWRCFLDETEGIVRQHLLGDRASSDPRRIQRPRCQLRC